MKRFFLFIFILSILSCSFTISPMKKKRRKKKTNLRLCLYEANEQLITACKKGSIEMVKDLVENHRADITGGFNPFITENVDDIKTVQLYYDEKTDYFTICNYVMGFFETHNGKKESIIRNNGPEKYNKKRKNLFGFRKDTEKKIIDIGIFCNIVKNNEKIGTEKIYTPLHEAVGSKNLWLIKYLVSQGASVQTRSYQNHPALKTNEKTYTIAWHNFPLHKAAELGQKNVVEFLYKKGADIFAKDENEKTPFDVAMENEHRNIAHFLSYDFCNIQRDKK